MNLYSIFDLKMNQYMPPFVAHNNGHAIRMFADHANEQGTPVNKHPEDYTLDHIAEFNEDTGAITAHNTRIAKAIDYVNTTPQPLDITDALKRKKGTA